MKSPLKHGKLLEMAQWEPEALANIAGAAQVDTGTREWAMGVIALGLAHLPSTGCAPTYAPLETAGFDPNWRDADGLTLGHHVLRQPENAVRPWRANYLAEMIDAGLNIFVAPEANPNWTVYGGIVAEPALVAGLRKRHEGFAVLDAGRRDMLAEITGIPLEEALNATPESVGPHHKLAWQQVMVVGMSEHELMQRSRSRLTQGTDDSLAPMSAQESRARAASLANLPGVQLEQGAA